MYPKIVEKIHNEFFQAETTTEKAVRLVKCGFENVKEVDSYNEKAAYYSMAYPFNKFITTKQVKKICDKYDLFLGEIKLFNGFVPDKNLKEIENFRLKLRDYTHFGYDTEGYGGKCIFDELPKKLQKELLESNETDTSFNTKYREKGNLFKTIFLHEKKDMKIVAPLNQFNLDKRYKVNKKTRKIELIDPIVLQPVEGGYLIDTAWGDEASDNDVINQIRN